MRFNRRNFVKTAAVAGVLEGSSFGRNASAEPEGKRMRVTAFPRAIGGDPSQLSEAALRHVRQMGVRDIRIVSAWVPGYSRDRMDWPKPMLWPSILTSIFPASPLLPGILFKRPGIIQVRHEMKKLVKE